jgi:hypothetical protein
VSVRVEPEPSAQHTSSDINESSKMYSFALIAAAIVPSVIAAPQGSRNSANTRISVEDNVSSTFQTPSYYDWSKGAVNEYEIHQSCNATQHALLRQALTETEILATPSTSARPALPSPLGGMTDSSTATKLVFCSAATTLTGTAQPRMVSKVTCNHHYRTS